MKECGPSPPSVGRPPIKVVFTKKKNEVHV